MIILAASLLVVKADRGDVRVRLGDSLWSQGAQLSVSGDTVYAFPEGSARITLPRTWGLILAGDSANFTVQGEEGESYPPWIKTTTFAGDLYLKNPFPTRLEFSSVSGDFTVGGSVLPGPWEGALYEVRTVSGRVDVLAPVPCSLKAGTGTGAVRVEVSEKPKRGYYFISTGSGPVEVKAPGLSLRGVKEDARFTDGGFTVEIKVAQGEKGRDWLSKEGAVKPGLVLDYNRVDGLKLGLSLELGSAARVWGAWRAGAGEPCGGAEAKVKLVRKPDMGLWAGAYDSTAFWDPWAPELLENFLGSLLFGEDGRVYFERTGFGGGLWFSWRKLNFKLGRFQDRLGPLATVPAWTAFGPGFGENPVFDSFEHSGVSLQGSYKNPGVTLRVGGFASDRARRAWVLGDFARQSWSWALRLRVGAGWASEAGEPFVFHVGGVYTVPGYRQGERAGSVAYLANLELGAKLHGWLQGVSALVDVGDAFSEEWQQPLLSVGLGARVFGLSVRFSKPLTGQGSPAIYLRLARHP